MVCPWLPPAHSEVRMIALSGKQLQQGREDKVCFHTLVGTVCTHHHLIKGNRISIPAAACSGVPVD